ncbi:DEAD/DEAH box helicase [Falsarthrobacter nasiphocae]|uniref:DEAD/DEAH box helicase domain-containing protein n=1 Tax=Falsarthrobacter nasiphocae TaxID=189863 RepID=A0AAE4C6A2_9MICC|nr:DEAD/DEAH box helicase [Falsarthrobacter nasiphocae]MDR6892358.1 DEAD/DEAH box helicase domain-containing protein [Falsarthrobacter nasiphocae]
MSSSPLSALGLSAHSRPGEPESLRHVRAIPARPAREAAWPDWVEPRVVEAFGRVGASSLWSHQAEALSAIHAGRHTIVATGTASGKSLAYQAPVLDALVRAEGLDPVSLEARGATALYLSPTKALAADQESSLAGLRLPGVRAAVFDGDSETSERAWIKAHANLVLTNPDMLHHGILPNHVQWARFLRRLSFVVVDEAHSYRGVFGSHVANLLRRLKRLCAHYGSHPVFIGASATTAEPAASFARLIGDPAVAVTEDGSPSGQRHVLLWEPELTDFTGENGAPVRRSSISEVSDLMADLVARGTRTIAFIKSRKGAEAISSEVFRLLDDVDPALSLRVAAYRSGYLPEERRELERRLRTGELLGLASTPALEMGIDIAGLDAVLVAGWPGTRASFFQQIGRAGRGTGDSLAVLVASDDPLDTYLVHHPEAIFGAGVEATVIDEQNPYILGPHLCAAAAERPIALDEADLFGPAAPSLLDQLTAQGYLRRRPAGWFWTHPESAAAMVSLRGDGGGPMNIIDADTGSLLGTMDSPQSHYQAHEGAVYTHQGATYLVLELNERDHHVLVTRANPDYTTTARDVTSIEVIEALRERHWDGVRVCFGDLQVQTRVVGFQRKAIPGGEVLGEEPLDLGARDLRTKGIWFEIQPGILAASGLEEPDLPSALHAAEHAMIGLLPLVASSDRWDIGGVSTALHADTGVPSIFVYDGHPGGAGFTERAFETVLVWLTATAEAIKACECASGCPSCVQSPKCGNRNNPLSKSGALSLLKALISAAGRPEPGAGPATPAPPRRPQP